MEIVAKIQPLLSLALSFLTFLGVIFAIYKYFREPDMQTANDLALMKTACKFKHEAIDQNIVLIKENHLKHIEADISEMKNDLTRVITIIEERMPKK